MRDGRIADAVYCIGQRRAGRAAGGVAVRAWSPAMTSPRIGVYLADDHPVYLGGLKRAVHERPELELLGESGDGRQALADLKRMEPDVALLDVRMPGLSGTQILEACRREKVATRIVFLSAHVESELIYDAMAKGAKGYLSKLAGPGAILDAVAAVHRGQTVLSPDFQSELVGELQRRETDTRPLLTERETQILTLTADGHSAPEIGRLLHLSTATIKTHLHTLYEKLGVSDRASAVAMAMRKGMLE
jgi:two-component system nitrate/nitrite response regulator NarL